MKILVTGGAGFIGSAVVRHIIENTQDEVRVMDCLTYAGNLESLTAVSGNERYSFSQTDITDASAVTAQFSDFRPDIVMHLAAESHVDRSIDGPAAFIQTNLIGTFTLLEAARYYWSTLSVAQKPAFRFHHISTDEVYGDLHGTDDLFTEETPYAPSSPYSASKAGSDHLVRAWNRTYGLPVVVTNCSNNYGPYHFPEKLIPLTGEVFDVAVDIRRSSPTFGKWVGVVLSAENKRQLWIPEGFAHGFMALSDTVQFVYKATNYYAPQSERSILWNDPAIDIEWPDLDGCVLSLSEKDQQAHTLATAEVYQ